MSRESSAKEWLDKAESDRDTAKYLLAGRKYDDCAFYIGSRYPLDSIDPSVFNETAAKSAIEKVDSVFTWFLTRVNFDKE